MRFGCNQANRVRGACIVAVLILLFSARAQELPLALKTASAATGSVTGYVHAAETGLPIGFAEIRLVPQPNGTEQLHFGEHPVGSKSPEPVSTKFLPAQG